MSAWHTLGAVIVAVLNTVHASAPFIVGAGDPGSTRLVYAMVAGLVVIGILFVVVALWLIRQTRVDPELLAPLERMGDNDWNRLEPAGQRRVLDEVRPVDAQPLEVELLEPEIDAEFDESDRPVQTFEDLMPGESDALDFTPLGVSTLPPDSMADQDPGSGVDNGQSETETETDIESEELKEE